MSIQIGEDGEPHFTVFHIWDRGPATDFRELSEAQPVHRPGRFFLRDAPWGVAVPADPALAPQLTDFIEAHPEVHVEEPASELLEELVAEYERASETVALSYAEDAELEDLELGGELHPFQRAGVRYALARRRTFIADEQGLGKTVQALATIEKDDAFPTVVVCPASMKLVWEREAQHWLPHRSVAVLGGRTDDGLGRGDGDRRDRRPQLRHPRLARRPARRAPAARADPRRVALREERPRGAHEGRARARRASFRTTRSGSRSPARRS